MTSVISVAASGGTQVTITFAGIVQISGTNLPQSWKFGTGAHLITAIISANGAVYVCTVAGTVASAQIYTMPGSDPAARTPLGGYVETSNGDLA